MTNLYLIVLIGVTVAFVAGQSTVDAPPPQHSILTTKAAEPTQPSPKPTDPTKPTPKPTDPTKPPPQPTDPTKPTPKPTEPTPKPTDPTKPTPKPTDPTKPTPEPTKPPKPTEPPTPPKPVDPTTGIWEVNDANKTCLLVKFALQIQIPYHYGINKTTELAFLDIPENATSSGVCGNGSESITLEWKQNVTDKFSQTVTLSFSENSTIHKYYLKEINVIVVPDSSAFPGIIDDEKNKTIKLTCNKHENFVTSLSKSYKCDKNQVLNLTDVDDNKPRGAIHISHVQFQAFEESKNKEFTNVEDCEPSDTPDIVPIAVGCALAVLVIVVLVAYLIGRRRRQARGYLSMFAGTKREADYIPMKHLSCFQ